MMALQEDGNIWAWGLGEDGRLGTGKETSHDRPVKVLTRNFRKESPVVKIFCGGSHSLALTDDGQLYTWGRGEEGQLGHGDYRHRSIPTLVEHFSGDGRHVVQVSGGNINSGALMNTGRIFTWGCTRHGESASLPKISKGMLSAEGHSVWCGYHTCFMVMRGAVKTGKIDYNLQAEFDEEMAAFEANNRRVQQKEKQRLDRIIAPKLGVKPTSNRTFGGGSHRFCRGQVSSTPVTAKILTGSRKKTSKSKIVREMSAALTSRDEPRNQNEYDAMEEEEEEVRRPRPPPRNQQSSAMSRARPSTGGSGMSRASFMHGNQIMGNPYAELDAMLSGAEGQKEDGATIHRFLRATGATEIPEFKERWGGLLEAEFGDLGENNPYAPSSLSEEELLAIGRATLQFR